jgi:ribosomal protein S18 acetylase RimI-like enzyme
MTTVTRTYLRLEHPEALVPRRVSDPLVAVARERPIDAARYRHLYAAVGQHWHWRDRDGWSDAQLQAHLDDPGVHVFVMRVGGETAGYVELQRHETGDVEIVYFGLLPAFIGLGLGAHLLTVAVEEAAHLGANSVWLHTCSLDHPAALANYQARGFVPFRVEQYETSLPGQPVHG